MMESSMLYGPMTPGFTAKQVTALAGVPYQTIHLWAKTGFIVPSVSQASGRGTERVYSFLDIVALRIAGELRRAGIPTRALKNVVRFLRERELLEDPDTKLAVVGWDVFIAKANDPISELGHLTRRSRNQTGYPL
jgi:DNA-binding transcriptional MerR regulator